MRVTLAAGLVSALLAVLAPPAAGAADGPVLGAWGVETRGLSASVRPGDDFYRYVNEGWLRTAAPPPGLPYANASVDAYLRTRAQLQTLIDGILASSPPAGSDEAQIAALYRSFVDVDRRNALGLTPLAGELQAIRSVASHADASRLLGRPFFKAPVDAGVVIDQKEPQRYVVAVAQGGLGLPGRDYYLSADAPYPEHRSAYVAHAADVLRRAGFDGGEAKAQAILAFETRLAAIQWTPAEQRDPQRSYRAMTLDELEAYAPGISWSAMFAEAGLGTPGKIVLQTDDPVRQSAAIFAGTDIDTVRAWLAFHLVDDAASLLSAELDEANFAFYGKRLSGIPARQAVGDRAKQFIAENYGEILGRAYAKAFFPPAHRDQMNRMVADLREAFRRRLDANVWMDEATRRAAVVKLDAIVSHVGYPDRYRDWSSVSFDPAGLVANKRAVLALSVADARARLGEARRDWQWVYPATEINAGYAATLNSITFPAGLLQSPFFDPAADVAVNYGSIGAVIGHELSHGFDDQGSQFDQTGALRNWWTARSRQEFEKRTTLLVEQFDGYEALPGLRVNGRLTLGENIADLGGLTVALEAYHIHVAREQGGRAPVIDGFTGDQRFFLAWAQLWRDVTLPDMTRKNVLTDGHSPSPFRVNGPLRNMDAWYEAFGVKEGDALYLPPARRARIW